MFVLLGVFYSPLLFFSFELKMFLFCTVCLAVVYCDSLFRSISVVTTSELCVGGGVFCSEPSSNLV